MIWGAKMACVVAIIIERCSHKSAKTMKKIFKKEFFDSLTPIFHDIKPEPRAFFRP